MSLDAIATAGSEEQAQKNATDSRKALVRELTDRIKEAKRFWQPQFERIRDDISFAGGDQWAATDKSGTGDDDKFQVNFVQRELNQQVSAIYAKNPTVTCERRKRLEYTVWDGNPQTLAQAQAILAQAAQLLASGQAQGAVPPAVVQAQAVVNDYRAGVARKALFQHIADTAELVFDNQLNSQQPDFESQMKFLILREKTTGVGFVGVKFQRINETVTTASATHADVVDRMGRVNALLNPGENSELTDAQKESIRLELGELQRTMADEVKPRQEGIVLDFKPSTSVIVDPKCRCLFQFIGAGWIAEELMMSPDAVRKQWGKDVTAEATPYQEGREAVNQTSVNTKAGGPNNKDSATGADWNKANVAVWIIYDKNAQMQYVLCDGYPDFLEEPRAPWPEVTGFWPILALKLNLLEIEENKPAGGLTVYGQSAVRLMKPMQEEMNRTQEALREHRVANRPGYLTGKDTFDKSDREAMANRSPHDVIPLNNIPPGGDTSKVLVPIPTVPIDPRLYETGGIMQQVLLVTGMQQANMGAQGAGEKATGQAIAEQSRITGVSSEVDSLNKFLSQLARIVGEMLFAEMSLETVKAIAGPGAAWPDDLQTRKEINQALYLEIEAGSMGRPNRAMEISNLQQMMPQLVQLAQLKGLPLDPLVKYAAKVLEFDFSVEDWLAQAQPVPAAMPGAQPPPMPGNAPNAPVPDPNQTAPVPGAQMVNSMLTRAQNTV